MINLPAIIISLLLGVAISLNPSLQPIAPTVNLCLVLVFTFILLFTTPVSAIGRLSPLKLRLTTG